MLEGLSKITLKLSSLPCERATLKRSQKEECWKKEKRTHKSPGTRNSEAKIIRVIKV